jgi:hypothetical protein
MKNLIQLGQIDVIDLLKFAIGKEKKIQNIAGEYLGNDVCPFYKNGKFHIFIFMAISKAMKKDGEIKEKKQICQCCEFLETCDKSEKDLH